MNYPRPALNQIPSDIVSISDYEKYAQHFMTEKTWAYIHGSAGDQFTYLNNLSSWSKINLINRVLVDLKGGHTRLELFNQQYEYPIFLAPVAYHKLAHPQGELACTLAASAMKTGMIVSTQASIPLEDIAQHAQTPLWFQLYIQHDKEFNSELIRRAETSGYKAIVITVDAPINGHRNHEQRAGFMLPKDISAVNLIGCKPTPSISSQAGESPIFGSMLTSQIPTWQDVEWIITSTHLPVILKGINHAQDAKKALAIGAAGIIVSNHGGRILDTQAPTALTLPSIITAIDGEIPVLVDGGIRRGTDIIKAIALGASAVLIGRPYIYGLAVAGAPGVAHVINILRAELESSMILTGCKTLSDINHEILLNTQ